MEKRFGLKDLVLFVLLFVVAGLAILGLYQQDRLWTESRRTNEHAAQQTALLASIQRSLEEQARSLASIATAPSPDDHVAPAAGDAWARPGIPITRPRPWGFVNDPRRVEGFAEGGTLTEVFEGEPKKLTPYVWNDTYYARIVNEVVCEQLAMYDSKTLELCGWLAESWQYDPAGLWLRVKLRDDARFSDGEPVTAEDVRFTFMDYVNNPKIAADMHRSQFEQVKRITAISGNAVEFEFASPKFNNLTIALRNPILPAHFYNRFTPDQINQSTGLLLGSGPYKFEVMDPENQWRGPNPVVLVRNELYWGVRPPVDRLRYLFVTDPVARLTEFENGDADIMRATPDQYRRKAADPSFARKARALAWTNMKSGYSFIAWNCAERHGKPTPFSDKRVRQAMALMTDRDRINRDFFEGLAKVAVGPFPPIQSDPAVKPWPFDMDRARALLAEAGWADRDNNGFLENERGEEFAFEFLYGNGSAIGESVGKYLMDQAARLGIRVTLKSADLAALQAIQDSKDFDAFTLSWSWSNIESDPYQIFHSSQARNEGDNWGSWINPDADELIEIGRGAVNEAERLATWRQLHRLIHDEQPYMFLLENPWIRFVSNRIENVHTYPVTWDRREFFIREQNP